MNLARSYLAWRLRYCPLSLSDDDCHAIPDLDADIDLNDDDADRNPPAEVSTSLPHIVNPVEHGRSLGTKLAKKPQYPQQDIESLVRNHGAIDFRDALIAKLEDLMHSGAADCLNFTMDKFDVSSRMRLAQPLIKDLSSSNPFEVIMATPASIRGWRKTAVPSQFSTALILRDGNSISEIGGPRLESRFVVFRS